MRGSDEPGEIEWIVEPPTDRPPTEGPRTRVIVGGTVLAAAVLAVAVAGYLAWQGGDDGEAAAPATTAPADGAPIDPAAGLLFTRTTAAGIEVRAASMRAAGQDDFEMWFPQPAADAPARCRVVDAVNAVAVTSADVLQTQLPLAEVVPNPPAPTPMYSSLGGGASVVGVVVQVDEATVLVRLTGPAGEQDEMEPVGGVAVLALPAVPGEVDVRQMQPDLSDYTLSAIGVGGRTRQVSGNELQQGPPMFMDEACFGGDMVQEIDVVSVDTVEDEDGPDAVDLPPVGDVQPADPAAARTAIQATFDEFYGVDADAVAALLDDPFAMPEMIGELGNGVRRRRFDEAQVVIEDLVFLSDVEAAVDYELELGSEVHRELFGRAKLVGERWVLSRATACTGLEFLDVTCLS